MNRLASGALNLKFVNSIAKFIEYCRGTVTFSGKHLFLA